MAVMSRLLPLVAFSTFAIFVLALLATPANALSNGPHGHVARGHDSIAKRKRNPVKRAKRCRPKTTSLAAASTSPAAAAATSSVPSSTKAAAATTPASSKPATTKATTKTSTSAAATSTPYSGGGSGGGGGLSSSKKLLLAWPNGPTDLEKYTGDNVGGMYTWSPYCPDNAKKLNIPCYPMLWGTKQKSVFTQQVSSDYNSLIFGFNEPNQGDQSNMTPQAAAALWIASIEPLRAQQGCKLVSPATTSAPTGIQWMKDMLAACNGGCTFDYVALHWYGTSIDEFKTYVNNWYTAFGKPLIISEYACQNFSGGAQCTKDQTNTFHYTMGAWFDQHQGVAMYGPFGFMHDMVNVNYDNQLMNSDGSPNDLAKWYLYH